jgi:hypothetical protein
MFHKENSLTGKFGDGANVHLIKFGLDPLRVELGSEWIFVKRSAESALSGV